MQIMQNRRRFVTSFALAGAAGLGGVGAVGLGGGRQSFATEPPPEVTTVCFDHSGVSCEAPKYAAEALLRAEGFTDIRYETSNNQLPGQWITEDELHWTWSVVPDLIEAVEAGTPVVMVAGLHVGCFELFAHEPIHTVAELKGRTVGARTYGSTTQLVRIMASMVGLDPDKDIHWAIDPSTNPKDLFIEKKIDAFFTTPPRTQELRARKIGHSILNTTTDRPWSQYFCCMLAGNAKFVRKYPVATKRLLRAILKAIDICAADPEGAARLTVDRGFAANYDYELQALRELPLDTWRDYDPDDSVRFYALRLNEAGVLKSAPQEIISTGTNWGFLNELKRELKT
jgi:NitT/TauT family transport system substrate-binding protein